MEFTGECTCGYVGRDKECREHFDLGISFKATALNEGKGLKPEVYLVVIRCQDGIYMETDNRVQWRGLVCYCDTSPSAYHLSHSLTVTSHTAVTFIFCTNL